MRLRLRHRRCVHVEVVRIQPGDVIIARTQQRLTQQQAEEVKRRLGAYFPNNATAVVPADVHICVARGAA